MSLAGKQAPDAPSSSSSSSRHGCPQRLAAVCGADGITYANRCFASSQNVAVTRDTACPGDALFATQWAHHSGPAANAANVSWHTMSAFATEGFRMVGRVRFLEVADAEPASALVPANSKAARGGAIKLSAQDYEEGKSGGAPKHSMRSSSSQDEGGSGKDNGGSNGTGTPSASSSSSPSTTSQSPSSSSTRSASLAAAARESYIRALRISRSGDLYAAAFKVPVLRNERLGGPRDLFTPQHIPPTAANHNLTALLENLVPRTLKGILYPDDR